MTVNQEMSRYWNEEGGTTWASQVDRFEGQLDLILGPLFALAAPQPGEQVVDIGCGPGATTIRAAEAVGTDGSVLGVDVSQPLIDLATQRVAQAGLGQASFLVADAQTTDLAARGPFDLLISRYGVMFFDDPVAAFTNLHAAMNPGGRMAFAAWKDFGSNAWMAVPMTAALQHLPPPPQLEPDAPGPWAFADERRVAGILEASGFQDVRAESLEGDLLLAGGGDVDSVYGFLQESSLGRLLLNEEDPEVAGKVEASVRAALGEHETSEGIRLPYATWLYSAKA